MACSAATPITFIVPGQALSEATTRGAGVPRPSAGLPRGRVKQTVRVGARRAEGGDVRVTAVPGEDAVVLHLAGGPALTLHPEHARDLMLAQAEAPPARGLRGAEPTAPTEVRVPAQLQWRGLEEGVAATRGARRGFLGDVLLSAVEVISDVAIGSVADVTAKAVRDRVDAQVDPGVYALQPDALPTLKGSGVPLASVPAAPGPLLVLVHGTFSETSGTFGRLWTNHPQRVRSLFTHYGSRVYALDHPTLGASPIDNALMLAEALPDGARVHLVTHSRGGLVAEVLARVCAGQDDQDFGAFAGKDHVEQRKALKALISRVRGRNIRVDRIVRVACPARGTLLASKRLDAYVSVLKWTLELAGIPVAPALVDFLGTVAQRRTDPLLIPGLAAQVPDSPLIQWLHTIAAPIPGDLRVVAGDLAGDSVVSWLKTLLADAFYWTDNDLVVQTRSMYGGAPRAATASFTLDQGGDVSHFNYFSNDRTAGAIVNGLIQDEPLGFHTIGPLSWAGESSTGLRAARRSAASDRAPEEKPAVFVLPGILGSNLKADGRRIWLGWRLVNGLQGLEYAAGSDGVEPDGPIDGYYDALGDFFSATHEVLDFPFDWRQPIEVEAKRLARAVNIALDARSTTGQPVRLLAHSMGGLVARTLALEAEEVWNRMLSNAGARVLMLGTPNAGSWAPMQVLTGDDTFGNVLVMAGAPFRESAARALMAAFPGFLQLQAALLDEQLGLSRRETWQALADMDLEAARRRSWWHNVGLQLNALQWGVPDQPVLDSAVALRRRLDAQSEALGRFKDRLLIVVGRAPFTPAGYDMSSEGLVYLDMPDSGDGRVTHESALLPGVRAWMLDSGHGDLPRTRAAFEAYLDLLQNGSTSLLPSVAGGLRSAGAAAPAAVRSRPSRTRGTVRPPEQESELLAAAGSPAIEARPSPGTALRITVVNGDLTFISQPLLLGHYSSLRLTGTEEVMNRLVGEAMSASLDKGLYPGQPGEHQVFVNTRTDPDNPWRAPRPAAVIVAGLGEEGKLGGADLVRTVRQAVLAWAQRVAETGDGLALFDLAATLVGSGGTGVSAGQAAQLITQGVREANERLDDEPARREDGDGTSGDSSGRGWPRVGHLYLVELYLDRATEAWRAVKLQAAAVPGRYVVSDAVEPGVGSLRRPLDSGYRGADYDFIAALSEDGPQGEERIAYTLDTKRARTEVRAQAAQSALLRDLVNRSSNDQNTDTRIGRTLFQLLVPVEMEPFLGGTTEMQIELDSRTAGIPWELLDTSSRGSHDTRPWAIRSKLVRKLRTADFRTAAKDATADAAILIIGEPECDRTKYARLFGARAEARAVEARFMGPDGVTADRIRALIRPDDDRTPGADARTVINALLDRDWRIVHIAGHGEPPEKIGPVPSKPGDPPQKDGDPRGVVLSNDTFLGPREIRNMRTVPQLVFVNCCHLAARNIDQLFAQGEPRCGYNRPQFAAGVAEALITLGVRCVIAAGWAVEDEPAKVFATTFYAALLRRRRFLDAVAEAREAAYDLGGNTWAAYQCYGDPDWLFQPSVGDAQRPSKPLADEYASVGSARGLVLALETLAVKSTYQKAKPEEQRARIRHLEARFAPLWGSSGAVAEAFGGAWAAAGQIDSAIEWYRKAVAANDGTASIKAAEQRANLQVRRAWSAVDKAARRRDALEKGLAALAQDDGTSAGARTAAERELAEAEGALAAAAHAASQPLSEAFAVLDALVAIEPSMERESLLGSAYKRQAMIDAVAGGPREEAAAIASMRQHYEAAEKLARTGQLAELFYPGLNRLAAQIIVGAGPDGRVELDGEAIASIRQSLASKIQKEPDFWSIVGQIELRVYEAIARASLAPALESIETGYQDLHRRVSALWMWGSVYDQARFVLPKYIARASSAERAAAAALLKRLEGWADRAG